MDDIDQLIGNLSRMLHDLSRFMIKLNNLTEAGAGYYSKDEGQVINALYVHIDKSIPVLKAMALRLNPNARAEAEASVYTSIGGSGPHAAGLGPQAGGGGGVDPASPHGCGGNGEPPIGIGGGGGIKGD